MTISPDLNRHRRLSRQSDASHEMMNSVKEVCVIQVLLMLLLLGAARNAFGQAHPPYQMLDSRFPAEDFYPTAWIDNNRVLFTGVQLGTYLCDVDDSRHCGGRGLLLAASVWDVRQNQVTKYQDQVLSGLCVQDGYISYRTREKLSDLEGSVFAGEFGKEKKLGTMSEYRYNNPISCRYYTKPWLPADARGRRIELLLEEHGYVDFGPDIPAKLTPEERVAPPVLRSLNARKAVPLDIEKRYRVNDRLRFVHVPFLREYLTQADTGRADDITPVFFMSYSGSVRRIAVPEGQWRIPMYFAVRPGVFIRSGSWRNPNFPRAGGGYLLVGGKVAKAITGEVRSVSVSPDGCNVAFVFAASPEAISEGYRDWQQGKPGNTIRMTNVCEGDKK